MTLSFSPLHPLFAAQVSPIDLRETDDPGLLEAIRQGMHQYGVLVFRNQPMTDDAQLAFAERFDGTLHAKTGSSALGTNRFGNEALADISNLDENGQLLATDDRRRHYGLANRLWHTDASFVEPHGRYSLLSARALPPVDADTEFADMRAAYDDLTAEMKHTVAPLHAQHSIAYSRQILGFEFSADEAEKLKGVVQPLVRVNSVTQRRALYLASHATSIMGWPLPEGRLLLHDLIEHATQPQYVYRHRWENEDLVIWDNLATMHRARPFQDTQYRRDLRRVTTLDLPRTAP